MRVEFHYYNGSLKRWFTKVARRAAERVSAIASRIDYQMPHAWSAEFTLDEAAGTSIHRICDSSQTTITVTFAAAGWQSLDSSADDAISQLASAVFSTVPPDIADQLLGAFIAAGFTRLHQIHCSSAIAAPDYNHHLELCINRPSLGTTEVHGLYDRLDARLREQGLGLVDGSSWSREGYCLDLSLPHLESGIRCVLDFAIEHGHYDFITLTDAETGERFHRKNQGDPRLSFGSDTSEVC
jgi:hypothetical protein